MKYDEKYEGILMFRKRSKNAWEAMRVIQVAWLPVCAPCLLYLTTCPVLSIKID